MSLLALTSTAGVALASASAQSADQTTDLLAYAAPHQLETVAPGRRINVFCMGDGSPTVVLNAGGASWSVVWSRVQPALAQKTRVCSWDRAGNGFSDASPEAQDIVHIEGDLEGALAKAGVTGPLILVGHSQGALESLIFADRRPDRVAAMVLVDPAYPGQAERLRRKAPELMAWSEAGDRNYYIRVAACIDALQQPSLAGAEIPAKCAALREGLPKPFQDALKPWDGQAAYWKSYLSDFEERDRNSKLAINPQRSLGDTPLVVFGAGILDVPGAPTEVAREVPAVQAEIARGQHELVRLSTKGAYVRVADSSHAIMWEKPELVTAAVLQLVADARAHRH